MPSITVLEHLSLDGVFQAPGRPDEDRRAGFDRGGWGRAYDDEVLGRTMGEAMAAGPGALLFGRTTYTDLVGWWLARDDGNPFTGLLRAARKYVVTTRPQEPLPYENSVAVPPAELTALKDGGGDDLTVMGSGQVVTSLREAHDQRPDDPGLGDTARLLHGMALLAEGGELADPAAFVATLSRRLEQTLS